MPPFARLLIEEGAAEAVAGIGAEQVDRPVADRRDELLDALGVGEIGLDRSDLDAEPLERRRRVDERRVGGDQQVVAVLRGELGELEADAASRRR